jgi:hypothetical protein
LNLGYQNWDDMPAKEVFITGMSSNNCEKDDVNETVPSLDENILKILGYDTIAKKTPVGDQLHTQIAEVWKNILCATVRKMSTSRAYNRPRN